MATAPYAAREVTQPPDWHGLVVWDFLFNAGTTGLFLVAAVADLARPAVFGPAATWAYPIALSLLLVDLLFLVLDLGHPSRFHHMLRVVKPSSPMSLGTWCLTAYSLPLTVAAASSLFGWDEVRRAAAAVGLLPALGAVGYKGVLFSTSSQPGWRDARWLGGYHTATAIALGAAGLLVLAHLTGSTVATHTLRLVVAASALLTIYPVTRLANELSPTVRKRYPGWVATRLNQIPVAALAVAGLTLFTSAWAGVAALATTTVSAWFVRWVVVLLPHQHPG